MMGRCWLLIVLVLEYSVLAQCLLFSVSGNNTIELVPQDSLVFFGETLALHCKVQSSIRNSDIGISVDVEGNTSPLEGEIVETNGSKTMIASISVAHETFGNFPNPTIGCQSLVSRNFTFIYPEWPIRNITNFRGVFHYDENKIIMSWDLGQYIQPEAIKVEVDYSSNVPPNENGSNCTEKTKESCIIEDYVHQDILFIRVVVRRSGKRPGEKYLTPLYDVSATSVHKFLPGDHRKTGPPTEFAVMDQNNTCLTLNWTNPKYFDYCECDSIYHIDVQREGDPEFRTVVDSAVRPYANARAPIQICSLIPFTTYTLRLKVKAKDINPWSEPAWTDGTTDEDVPRTGPPLTDTSYLAKECKGSQREITVYWNSPAAEDLRGKLVRFEVVQGNETKLLRKGSNFHNTMLSCNSSYDISIYSVTAVGRGIFPTVIHVPKTSEAIAVPQNTMLFKVQELFSPTESKEKKNISVTWNKSGLKEDLTVVFYHGQGVPLGNVQTFLYDYESTEISEDKQVLTLNHLPISEDLFGYALINYATGQKSGIQWIDCIYKADSVPGKPSGLQVTSLDVGHSLLVTWTTSYCSKNDKVLIHKFHIRICKDAFNKDCLTDVVNSSSDITTNKYSARQLEAGQEYHVSVKSESAAGEGPWSDPVTASPKQNSEDNSVVVATIVGAVFSLVIVLGSIGFCLLRRCRVAYKKYGRLVKDAKTMFKVVGQTEPSRNISQESGFASFENGIQVSDSQDRHIAAPPVPPIPPGGLPSLQQNQLVASVVESESTDTADNGHDSSAVQSQNAGDSQIGAMLQAENELSSQETSNHRANEERATSQVDGFQNQKLALGNSNSNVSNYIRMGIENGPGSNSASGQGNSATDHDGHSSSVQSNQAPSTVLPDQTVGSHSQPVLILSCHDDVDQNTRAINTITVPQVSLAQFEHLYKNISEPAAIVDFADICAGLENNLSDGAEGHHNPDSNNKGSPDYVRAVDQTSPYMKFNEDGHFVPCTDSPVTEDYLLHCDTWLDSSQAPRSQNVLKEEPFCPSGNNMAYVSRENMGATGGGVAKVRGDRDSGDESTGISSDYVHNVDMPNGQSDSYLSSEVFKNRTESDSDVETEISPVHSGDLGQHRQVAEEIPEPLPVEAQRVIPAGHVEMSQPAVSVSTEDDGYKSVAFMESKN